MKKKKLLRYFALSLLALILAACAWSDVGDLVWLDQNGNGFQDPGEPGVEGVEVQVIQLFASEGRPAGSVAAGFACFPMNLQVVWEKSVPMLIMGLCSDITDANGNYRLGWPAGGVDRPYAIKFILPNGYEFTTPHIGHYNSTSIEVRDSDVDPQFGVIPLPNYHINMDRNGGCQKGWESLCVGISWIQSYPILDAGLIALSTPTPEIVILQPTLASVGAPEVSVSVPTNCRSGPSASYSYVATIEIGQKVEVVAVFPESEYAVIMLPDGKVCWLWLRYADITDLSEFGLPEATQPPTPTPGPTQTPKPTKTPSPTPTPTPTQYIG